MSIMGVWVVPEGAIEAFGQKMGDYKAVSHCFLRPVAADWPYNMFTTVHGRSVDECESTLETIANDTGVREKAALFPVKEYKRTKIAYFSPELEVWESARSGEAAASAAS